LIEAAEQIETVLPDGDGLKEAPTAIVSTSSRSPRSSRSI
jgi:hypothetical protein